MTTYRYRLRYEPTTRQLARALERAIATLGWTKLDTQTHRGRTTIFIAVDLDPVQVAARLLDQGLDELPHIAVAGEVSRQDLKRQIAARKDAIRRANTRVVPRETHRSDWQ
jgi:hypothetical protein